MIEALERTKHPVGTPPSTGENSQELPDLVRSSSRHVRQRMVSPGVAGAEHRGVDPDVDPANFQLGEREPEVTLAVGRNAHDAQQPLVPEGPGEQRGQRCACCREREPAERQIRPLVEDDHLGIVRKANVEGPAFRYDQHISVDVEIELVGTHYRRRRLEPLRERLRAVRVHDHRVHSGSLERGDELIDLLDPARGLPRGRTQEMERHQLFTSRRLVTILKQVGPAGTSTPLVVVEALIPQFRG
jgi:hypothetical protein